MSGVGVVAGVLDAVVAFLAGQLAAELEALTVIGLVRTGTQAASSKAAIMIGSK